MFTPMARRHWVMSASSNVPPPPVPALFISTCTLPWVSNATSARCLTASKSATSVGTPMTSWPLACRSATVASSTSAFMSARTTFMPSLGEQRAHAPPDATPATSDDGDLPVDLHCFPLVCRGAANPTTRLRLRHPGAGEPLRSPTTVPRECSRLARSHSGWVNTHGSLRSTAARTMRPTIDRLEHRRRRLGRARLAWRAHRGGPELVGPVSLRLADARVDAAGHQRGHTDAVAGDLGAQVLGDRDDRGLRRRVRLAPGAARERDDRRGVHDMALGSLREHARQELVQAVDDAEHVHAVDPPPVFDAQLGHLAEHEHARVVAQHVHRAERLVRAARRACAPSRRRSRRRAPRSASTPCSRARSATASRASSSMSATTTCIPASANAADHPAADAAPAAGHHRDLSRQLLHRACLPRGRLTGDPRGVQTGVPRRQLKVAARSRAT